MGTLPNQSENLRNLLLSSFPHEFFQRWNRELKEAYREAVDVCERRFRHPEFHDVLGHYRRALAEDSLVRVAEEFPEVRSRRKKNRSGNYFHRIVSAGPIILTECYSSNCTVVREAVHRMNYAQRGQGHLWDGFDDSEDADDASIYGVLQHGAHPKEPDIVAYVKVFFPNANCDRYVSQVDLLGRFPATDRAVVPPEEVPGETPMRPRRQQKEDDQA